VSGYVLLAQRQSVLEFYQKRLRRIAIPIIVWTGIYLVWTQILSTYYATPLPVSQLLSLIAQGVPYYHLWYLYMLLGLYLVTPLLQIILGRLSRTRQTILWVSLLVVAVSSSPWFTLSKIPFIFWCLPFLGYYLFGYWLREETVTIPSRILLIIAAVMVAVTALGSYLEAKQFQTNFGAYMYGYLSPNVMITALAVTIFFKQTASFWQQQFERYPILTRLSDSSFLVYLLHPFLLDLLRLVLPIARLYPLLSVIVVPLLFTVFAWLAALLLRRLPLMKYLA
jgi:surface polysaccharide O-acyltransferase-like enzyme